MAYVEVETHYDFDMGGYTKSFQVAAKVHYSYDSDYGADADNNRGVPSYEVDDITDIGLMEEDSITKVNEVALENDFPEEFENMLQQLIKEAF